MACFSRPLFGVCCDNQLFSCSLNAFCVCMFIMAELVVQNRQVSKCCDFNIRALCSRGSSETGHFLVSILCNGEFNVNVPCHLLDVGAPLPRMTHMLL